MAELIALESNRIEDLLLPSPHAFTPIKSGGKELSIDAWLAPGAIFVLSLALGRGG